MSKKSLEESKIEIDVFDCSGKNFFRNNKDLKSHGEGYLY